MELGNETDYVCAASEAVSYIVNLKAILVASKK